MNRSFRHICALFALSVAALNVAVDAECCTTAIISAKVSGTGRPMLWKQRDSSSPWNHIEHFKGTKYAYTALVDDGGSSVWIGVNDVGFAIGNNVSYNAPDTRATSSGTIMSEALGTCATVDEFESYLNAQPLPLGIGSNFAVIDGRGGAAYFETGDYGFVRFDVSDAANGYLIRTNFSLSGAGTGRGYERFNTATRLFGQKQSGFTPDWIFNVAARDFSIPLTSDGNLAVYRDVNIPRFTTIASVVVEGINPGENATDAMIWAAVGYVPAAYAIPVWVAAADEIPCCLTTDVGRHSSATIAAERLKELVFPQTSDQQGEVVDENLLFGTVLPLIRRYEQTESFSGIRLRSAMMTDGFSTERIKKLNTDIDRRFDAFAREVEIICAR